MARNNHPRFRQARQLARKQGQRPPYDRVLIVCEGRKTEPLYFDDIRRQNSLPSAHVRVLPSGFRTEPRQVVDFAEQEFLRTRAYERVYAVFDRDTHLTYHDALIRATALNGRYRNDEGRPVRFGAVVSVPCFELWLLLHFEDTQAFWNHRETIERLTQHIPSYEKGMTGVYALVEPHLDVATERARRLRARFVAENGTDPFTSVDELVEFLRAIRRP